MPETVARFAERFTEHAATALDGLTERSMLLHGDIRADNMFFAGDELKIVDFQFACGVRVRPISPTWSVRDCPPRSGAARTKHWCVGISDPWATAASHSFDEAWRHYRLAVGFLMVLPVITLLGWDAVPQRSETSA